MKPMDARLVRGTPRCTFGVVDVAADGQHYAMCGCGWYMTGFASARRADKARRAHVARVRIAVEAARS